MKKFHSLTAILLVLCLMGSLAGCSGNSAPEGTTADPVSTDPTHFYEEVRENFLIDAEVFPFPEETPRIYECFIQELTQNEVSAFLTANGGDAVATWDDNLNLAFENGFNCTTAQGGTFSFREEKTGMYPSSYSYTLPQSDWWKRYYLYVGQNHYDENAEWVFADRFMEPKDFAFASAADADAAVRSALETLGLTDLVLNRTLYIDHNTLSEITPILRDDPKWQPFQPDDGTVVTNPTRDDWTEADDGYIFEYFLGIHGCPMVYAYLEQPTNSYLGASIEVWYQKDGIVKLTVENPWVCGEVVEEPEHCITASEALATARVRLENTLSYANATITKVSAEYMYQQDGDRFLLKPVWVVYGSCDLTITEELTIPRQEYVIIDAITGKEL